MQPSVKLTKFYESLKDISLINDNIDQKREQLRTEVYNFNKLIQAQKVDSKLVKQNKEMADLLSNTIDIVKKASNFWVENFEKSLKNEKFRSELTNYFIIIIFGKVKAGKSSLGNFIAKHKLPEQDVEFFKYDEAGKKQDIQKLEEINEDSFNTDNLECTVQIQGFKLDGMAWIDTPGLGSMVKENGELAKDYIQAADYIIYPTSSDSPLQQDEKAQLQELFSQNKKVTICITKSDEKIEDECECGSEEGCEKCKEGIIEILQNKSQENRILQEGYVRQEIHQIIPETNESVLGDIYSISTHMATKAIEEKNEQLLEESNIPKFYELIAEVLTNKAKMLKSEAPYSGLKSFIENEIIGQNDKNNSISGIKKALDELDTKIFDSLEKFETLQSNANADLDNEVDSVVSEYYSQINQSNSKKIFTQIDNKLHENIVEIIQNNIEEIFADFEQPLTSLATAFNADAFEIKDVYQEITHSTKERNKKIGSGLFGGALSIGATIVSATLLASNPVGWAVAAGTIAAGAAGNYIGGKIGEATGSESKESIKVGNNKEDAIQKFKTMRLEHYEKYAQDIYQLVQDTFFTPLQKISNSIHTDVEQFEKNLNNIL